MRKPLRTRLLPRCTLASHLWHIQTSMPSALNMGSARTSAKTSRRKRYRREKMIKITTPSQRGARYEHSKPIKKKSVYFWNDNPSITPASKRATATFLTFFSTLQRWLPSGFPCALPPPLERAHAFPYLRIARLALFRWQISRDGLLEDLPEAIYVTRVDLDFPPVLQGFSYNVHIYCY